MKKRLTELLEEAATVMDCPQMNEVADYLIKKGVLAPPVKDGQTVYSPCPSDNSLDESFVYKWKVKGVAYKRGRWYAIDEDGYLQAIGDKNGCFLTRKEAERALKGEQG